MFGPELSNQSLENFRRLNSFMSNKFYDNVHILVQMVFSVCTQMLMLRQPSDDYLMMFNSLCEKAETMDAFTDEQKKRVNMWRSQLIKDDIIPAHNGKPKKNNNNHHHHR